VANTFVGVLTFVIVVRLLTTFEIGLMATLLLVLQLSQTAVALGLPSTLTKFVAQTKRHVANRLIRNCLGVILTCSIVVGAVVVVYSSNLSLYLSKTLSYSPTFVVLGFAIISGGLYQPLAGILMGQQKIKEFAKLDTLRFLIQQGLAATLVILGWRLLGVIIAWAVGYSFFAVSGYLVTDPRKVGKAVIGLKKLLWFSAPLYARDSLTFAYNWVDRAILLLYVPLTGLGIYNVAFTGFGILAATPGNMAMSLFPHYSKLSSGTRERLQLSVQSASRYIALVVSPLTLGMAALAPAVMRIFGPAYQSGAVALIILSVSLFASLPSYSLGSILVALNVPFKQSASTITSVLISLLVGIILVPRFGINGSAIARGLGMIASLIIIIWLVKNEIALKFDSLAIIKSAVASTVMALVLICLEFSLRSILFLPIFVLAGSLVYVTMLRLEKAIDRADLELFKAFVGERLAPIVERFGAWLVT